MKLSDGLGAATVVAGCYFYVGEMLPRSLASDGNGFAGIWWSRQQILLLGALSLLAVLLSLTGGFRSFSSCPKPLVFCLSFDWLFAAMNIAPLVAAVVATYWNRESGNCPVLPYEGASDDKETPCDYAAVLMDVLGVLTARLMRWDLGVCLLLAVRGDRAWLTSATGGWLGLPEAVPLHRIAGWWCVGQSALHSAFYLIFYPYTGGLASLWLNCFPASTKRADADGVLNRLGLVNFFGLVAFVAMLPLVVCALPLFRRHFYHIFQWTHLPLAVLFVVCGALHDRPILIFALPAVAEWYHGRRSNATRLLPAKARLLPGTSGPWVELTVECGDALLLGRPEAPRGEWASVRVVPLGIETHPFSVAISCPGDSSDAEAAGGGASPRSTELSALVAATAGDWSDQLAAVAREAEGGYARFEAEVAGPFRVGGGDWSLSEEPALLLLAGGTGVFGWLPALAKAANSSSSSDRYVHLVWCVKTEEDYLALASQLPAETNVHVTVFITRADTISAALPTAAPKGPWDDVRRAPQGGDGSTPSPSVWVPLLASFVGLGVGYWGWLSIYDEICPGHSLWGYTLKCRILPIVLILGSVGAALVAGSLALKHAVEWKERKQRKQHERNDGTTSVNFTPLMSHEAEGHEGAVAPEEERDSAATKTTRDLRLETGRPDLLAVVRAAAAAATSRHGTNIERMVVAACGPPELVEAAQRAVASARQSNKRGQPCLRLAFSGTDSRW